MIAGVMPVIGLAAIVLADEPVRAEWTLLDDRYQEPGFRMVFVDRDSIRQEDGLGTVSILIDWAVMQGGRSPTRFYSTIARKQVDCPNKLIRLTAFADYSGHRGTGKRMAWGEQEGPWRPVEPGSVNEGIWTLMCGQGASP
ncbi:MAG: hypothetical protein NNA22_08580 [Nitrospira sp.]|nr:hypothetical protein [Nitrospira sp.]